MSSAYSRSFFRPCEALIGKARPHTKAGNSSKVLTINRMSLSSACCAKAAEGLKEGDAVESSSLNGSGDPHPWHERFDIVEDRVTYKRYLTVFDRTVRFTPEQGESHTVHYDVVGHPHLNCSFAVAFPFHPATDTTPAQVTVVREYAQGPNCLLYCLPSGGFDPRKHASLQQCAEAEMAEEAMLAGGEVVPLMPEDAPGQSEIKWCQNTFKPFLFIDPKPDTSGHAARDAEEHTIEVLRVTIPELRKLIASGQVMLPSVFACFLGFEVLAERKLI